MWWGVKRILLPFRISPHRFACGLTPLPHRLPLKGGVNFKSVRSTKIAPRNLFNSPLVRGVFGATRMRSPAEPPARPVIAYVVGAGLRARPSLVFAPTRTGTEACPYWIFNSTATAPPARPLTSQTPCNLRRKYPFPRLSTATDDRKPLDHESPNRLGSPNPHRR